MDPNDVILGDEAPVYLDLRLLPLVDVGLLDLEVDALDSSGSAHDFNTTQVRLEVVEHAASFLQESLQSTTASIAYTTPRCIQVLCTMLMMQYIESVEMCSLREYW